MEDYLQMVSAEQKEYAEVFDWSYVKKKYKLNVTNFLPFVDSFA